MNSILVELINKWERTARFAYASADKQDNAIEKRFIEHGAICYSNCVSDLKEALASSSFLSSTTQAEHQTQPQQQALE